MIIFELILTIFKLNVILRGSWGSIVNGRSLKSNHHKQVQLAQIHETLCTFEELFLLRVVENWSSIFRRQFYPIEVEESTDVKHDRQATI